MPKPLKQTVMDGMVKTMNVVHRGLLKATGGRVGYTVMGMAAVELHTTGRKSGQRRSVMLTSPISEPGKRYVVVASKGGDDRHPDWYHNILAEPNVELTIEGATSPWRARPANAEERAELWPQVVSKYKNYAGYQKRTEREIPLVICEPR